MYIRPKPNLTTPRQEVFKINSNRYILKKCE